MSLLARAWRRHWHLLLPLLLAPLLALLSASASVDRDLLAPYFDAQAHRFPLRDNVFLQNVMHSGLKLLVIGIGAAVFGAFVFTFILPQWLHHRRRLLWLFAGMAGGSLLVSIFKHHSALHCPWDLAEYGGYAPFHGLFDRLPDGVMAGRCFPGGHATGGFSLMTFYFAWRDTHAARARVFLAVGLAAGLLMGWAQMMRGAHFLSHNLWSGWVVWVFLALFYRVMPPHAEQGNGIRSTG